MDKLDLEIWGGLTILILVLFGIGYWMGNRHGVEKERTGYTEGFKQQIESAYYDGFKDGRASAQLVPEVK